MTTVDKATHPEPAAAAGSWSVRLDEHWLIGDKPHGGYLLAVLARAAAAEATSVRPGHDTPQAVTATFLRAPSPGPATVAVEVLRRGRGVSQLRARLDQDAASCVDAAVVLAAGHPPGGAPDPDVGPAAPPVTARDDCPRSPARGEDGRGRLPLMDVVDVRLSPETAGFLHRRATGRGRITGWAELDDRTPWSPVSLLVALDVLPPATFDLGLTGWTPTMSLSAVVHAAPAPGPVRLEQWVEHLSGDRLHEVCRAWDARDRLVGRAEQLAGVRR